MPTPEHTPGTWSSLPRLKAGGVLAALITLAVVLALTAFAQIARGHPAGQGWGATTTTIPRAAAASASGAVSRSVRVVGIGDSVTSGYSCDCEPFVGLYATDLASQRGLATSSVNLGADGGTSSQLLASMTQPGAFRDQVANADIVLVTIGANDLMPLESKQPAGCPATCYTPVIDSVGHNVELIVDAARAPRPDHPPTILVTDYWNVFQDGDVGTAENGSAFQSWSDTLTRAESTQVCAAARKAGATCVSLYAPFKGGGSINPTSLLAADGDHPNAAGHQLIASTLLAATPRPLP
ncbi:MAG TPA: SGNH/GDSL hydrolase family protein [Dermatophilaceae bacterium]